jgi:hypothetical protein
MECVTLELDLRLSAAQVLGRVPSARHRRPRRAWLASVLVAVGRPRITASVEVEAPAVHDAHRRVEQFFEAAAIVYNKEVRAT